MSFDSVRVSTPQHSSFSLSHDWKGSLKMGKLVPVLCVEALPSDRFNISADALFRMMPMVSPPMQKIDIFFHAFFIPNRLLWPNWSKFIWGGQIGDVVPSLPTLDFAGEAIPASSLANYLGMPVAAAGIPIEVNALRWAAYQRCWYDWYRDQNLEDELPFQLTDGDNSTASMGYLSELRDRAWEHDYFTSALPFVQKGPDVIVPLDFSQVQILARTPGSTTSGFNPVMRDSSTGAAAAGSGVPTGSFLNTNGVGSTILTNGSAGIPVYYDPLDTLYLSGVGGSTVNDMRAAQALQRWLEKNARGGSRDIEGLRIHFGVRSSDARLDRAEYLGGSKSVMSISEVLQTSSTDATSPQGNMAGHGISATGGSFANYQCEEHGYFMVIMSIRPKTAYFQGIGRDLLKRDRLDYYFQEFAHLGEQPIFNVELNADASVIEYFETFGYVPRFNEYRNIPSRICGQIATSLDYWTLARKFASGTVFLNEDFIHCVPDKRIFVVTDPDEDEIIAHIFFNIMARRPLPMYGTPI